MGASAGPNLAGIGRGGDSNLVLEMDAHDAKSYPGEPTTNELFDTRTSLHYGWGSSYMLNSFPIAPTVAYSSSPNSFTAPVPVPGKIEFGTYWPKTWWEGDINLGASRAFSAGDTIMFSGWYLPWTSEEAAIIAAGRGLSSNNMGLHIYSSAGGHGQALDLKPVAGGAQPVNGFNHWWYFEFLLTIPSGGVTGNVRIEDRGWDYYFNNSGSSGGAAVFDVKYYWCNVQIELKPYRTPLVRKTGRGVAAGEVSGAYSRPASVNLMIHGNVGTGTSFYDSSPSKHVITNSASQMTHSSAQSKFPGGAIYGANVSNNFLSVAGSTDFDFGTSTDFTIDYWMYHSGTIASWDCMFELGRISGGGQKGVGNYLNSDGRIRTHYQASVYDSAAGVISANTWYHIAVVRRGSVWGTYVDGVYKAGVTSSVDIGQYTDNFHIHNGVHTTSYPWAGYLDEFRVTKGTALYSRDFTPPTRRNLSAPVVDRSGNHNGGNFATKETTDVTTYRVGEVIRPIDSAVWDFDGTDDEINMGHAGGAFIKDGVDRTIAQWVMSPTTTATYVSSLGYRKSANETGGWMIYWRQGYIRIWAAGGSHSPEVAGNTFVANTIYHVVATWPGTSGQAIKLYINGEYISAADGTTGTSADSTSNELSIGRYGANTSFHYTGKVYNTQIYDTILTPQQVKENFNQQRNRFGV